MTRPGEDKEADYPAILTCASVTRLGAAHCGAVLVAGSHGGLIAAALAARAQVHALILSDAGIGLDNAGIAGLCLLEDAGMAAAAVDVFSARIGDGADMLARGVISRVNTCAAAAGVHAGMTTAAAAALLRLAAAPHALPPPLDESVHLLRQTPGQRSVWGLDTVSQATVAHDDAVVVCGSHGALLDGRPELALRCAAHAALFNDAGIGIDDAGIGRLPALDLRGIAAAAVDAMTARIGDARSTWESGIVSRVNRTAARAGARPGMTARDFTALFLTC
ncbi:MAG: hypothetical protein BWK76_20830 [Desulfobulbaceae bacterium A2]|nr:MAG: hypothetical protein BWK76_20830 [Desulfobulbaceae bacterium A2]